MSDSFTDGEGYQHNRIVDPEDGAVFCDHDNEFWPCGLHPTLGRLTAAHFGSTESCPLWCTAKHLHVRELD